MGGFEATVGDCVVTSGLLAALVSPDSSCGWMGISLLHSRKRSPPLKLAPKRGKKKWGRWSWWTHDSHKTQTNTKVWTGIEQKIIMLHVPLQAVCRNNFTFV